uniref:Membrane-associated kinase regulator 4 n=1 Tax=Rodentolepis nana TaxID=102285 RepID=A0A0R3TKM6_RODNA
LLEGAATTPKRVWKLTNTYDGEEESLDTFMSSPYLEAQNIADLAVEKHFEKSLATFHAKQAAAAAAAATSIEDEVTSKASLDLSLPRTQPPFSPSSSSSSSHSSSALLSPREDPNGGPSFNPKKKWLAQYGDDEVARTDVGERKNDAWSSDDSAWNVKNTFNFYKEFAKLRKLSRATAERSPEASLSQRDFLSMTRTISLEIPSIGDSIDFFDDEDEAVMVTKSISAQESPVSSPIAASSGFFTDSTYSLDSFNLPVISEAGYLSSNVSVSSIFKARHLAAPRENSSHAKRKERGFFGCESEERNAERCWPIRKRTAFNASDLSCFKRSRSVVDADCVEHS